MGYPHTVSGKVKVSESAIVTSICEWMVYNRYFFWRQNNIPVYGRSLPKYTPKGLPDLFCLYDGLLIGIEVKRPASDLREANGRTTRGGQLTPYQQEFGNKLIIHGAKYIVVRSLDELDTEFETIRQNHVFKKGKFI